MTPEEIAALVEENAALRAEVAAWRAEAVTLRQQVEELREQLEEALQQLAELEQRRGGPPGFVKPNRRRSEGQKGPRKKRAPEHNTSRKRGEPTRVERHVLERCPACDYRLSGESIDYTREVVELPPPQQVEVIEHQVIKRWCPHCGKWRRPRLDLRGQVLGRGRIGVRIASVVVYLRTRLRLPVASIQSYLETMHGLRLSKGEIVELTHRVGRELTPVLEELKAAVQTSTVVHCDETGWRENGQNGYIWAFATPGPGEVRYFVYAHSRGHAIPQSILGHAFRGWLVSDFYSAYNLIPGRHQRCWAHLLDDLHELKEAHAQEAPVVAWAKAVRGVYDEAQAWLKEQPQASAEARQAAYQRAHGQICALGEPYARVADHPCRTLAKRLLRHQDELFGFLLVPGLSAHNNLVERSLRPLVIARKISGGSRSAEGSRSRMALFSLMQTWAANGLDPFQQCLAALQQPTAHAPP
jgi:transposase